MRGFRHKCGINYLNETHDIAYYGDKSMLVSNSKVPEHWYKVAPLLLGDRGVTKHSASIYRNRPSQQININDLASSLSNAQMVAINMDTRMNGIR